MSSFDTLVESTTIAPEDHFLLRQGGGDGILEVSIVLDLLFPVGAIIAQVGTQNPNTRGFQGTWELIEEDIAFENILPSDSVEAGVVVGSNTSEVVLPQHSHTGVVSSAGAHSHTYDYTFSPTSGDVFNPSDEGGYSISSNNPTAVSSSAGAHSHTTTVDNTGTPSTTIDVRGKRIGLLFWERIN